MKTKLLLMLLFVSSYIFSQIPTGYAARYDFTQGNPINLAAPGTGDLSGTIDQTKIDRFGHLNNAIRVNAHQLDGYTVTSNPTNFTVAYWMKGGGPNGSYQRIFKIIDGNGNGIDMANMSSNRLQVSFRHNGTVYAGSTTINSLYDSAWHHVAFVVSHDGSNYNNKIYIDGVVNTGLSNVASTASTANFLTSNAQFKISPQSGNNRFYDQIDDILIYENDLTQQEITDIININAPTPPTFPVSGYVARYDFITGDPINLATPGNGDLSGTIDQTKTDRFGYFNNAIRVNAHQLDGHTVTSNPTNFTVAYWMKGGGPNGSYQRIFKIIDGNGNGIDMANMSSNRLHVSFRHNGTVYAGSTTINSLYDSAWHHVAFVVNHDGSNYNNKIYIDGVVNTELSNVASTTSTANFLTSNAQFKISPQSSNRFYDQIDDILIYESALTIQQVVDIKNYNPYSTASVDDNEITSFSLYPNPVKDVLNISMDETLKYLEIYNIQGQKVVESDSKQVNVSNLSNGFYVVKIEDEDGRIATQKFIKN